MPHPFWHDLRPLERGQWSRRRVAAAEQGTSVSKLVTRYLEEVVSGASGDGGPDLVRTIERVRTGNPGFSAGGRRARDELYAHEIH